MVRMIVIMGWVLAVAGCTGSEEDGNAEPAVSVSAGTSTGGAASSSTGPGLTVCEIFEGCATGCAEIDLGKQTTAVRRDCLVLCSTPEFGMSDPSIIQWGETCAGIFVPEGGSSTGGAGSSTSGGTTGDASTGTTVGGSSGGARGGPGSPSPLPGDRDPSPDEPTCEAWTAACQSFEDAAAG